MPLRNDTLRLHNTRNELEGKLSEIDDAIKIFSRPRVFIKQEWDTFGLWVKDSGLTFWFDYVLSCVYRKWLSPSFIYLYMTQFLLNINMILDNVY